MKEIYRRGPVAERHVNMIHIFNSVWNIYKYYGYSCTWKAATMETMILNKALK